MAGQLIKPSFENSHRSNKKHRSAHRQYGNKSRLKMCMQKHPLSQHRKVRPWPHRERTTRDSDGVNYAQPGVKLADPVPMTPRTGAKADGSGSTGATSAIAQEIPMTQKQDDKEVGDWEDLQEALKRAMTDRKKLAQVADIMVKSQEAIKR